VPLQLDPAYTKAIIHPVRNIFKFAPRSLRAKINLTSTSRRNLTDSQSDPRKLVAVDIRGAVEVFGAAAGAGAVRGEADGRVDGDLRLVESGLGPGGKGFWVAALDDAAEGWGEEAEGGKESGWGHHFDSGFGLD